MATLTQSAPLPKLRATTFRLPILDSYLLREMIGWFFIWFGAFLLFWALNIFFLAADYIVNQHAPVGLTLRFVVFRMPQAIPMAFPFACLLSSLLAMGRMMGDNEIAAMRTSGIAVLRIAAAPLLFGFAMFVTAYLMNEYVAPPSVDISTRSFYQIIYHTDSLPVEQQFFRRDAATGYVYFVSEVTPDLRQMTGVQVYIPSTMHDFSQTLQAKTATVQEHTLTLHDVIRTNYDDKGFMSGQEHLEDLSVPLPQGENAESFVSSVNSDPWTMNSAKLGAEVAALEAQGIGGTALGTLQMQLADKLAWPFASFIGVLVAIPLAIRFGKRGRALGIALAIITFFIYYLMVQAMSAFGRNGAIDPYLAAWLPNIIFGTAGAVLLWMEER
jgi:lipopolysaccharide export system permease protein